MALAGSSASAACLQALEYPFTPSRFQVPLPQHYGDSLVSLFFVSRPRLPTAGSDVPADSPGLGWCCRFDCSASGCVLTVINGGFSFTVPSHLLPLPGPRGFLLHAVTRLHGPRLISTTRESATLCSLRASALSGFVRFGFLPRLATLRGRAGGLPWVRHYDLPTYRPPPHRFASPDIGSRLFASARPAPRSHIGGSLFVTYVGSTSCFLSTWRFCARSCLVGVALPSGNGGQFYFRRTASEDRS